MADKSLNKSNPSLTNQRYDHKWGYSDSTFVVTPDRAVKMTGNRYDISGKEMPELIPFIEEILGVPFDPQTTRPESADKFAPPPIENPEFLEAVRQIFPPYRYSQEKRERIIHSHGQTTADEVYKVLYGRLDRVADIVFWPESDEDLVNLIQLAKVHDVCLVPYGGGTSVSCALQLPSNEKRVIAVIDMRRMNRILWIDKKNFRAEVQAGITGSDLEAALEKEGFTCGHEPDSMELSTLGGWIATNASGMKKNRYGNIEQIVENITMITSNGTIEQLDSKPRLAMGMQPQTLLFGSEGNLGVITKAIIRIHLLPEVKKYGSIVFPNFHTGIDFLYELSREGVYPASIRLLDNVQFRFGSALKPRPTAQEQAMTRLQKAYLLQIKKFDPHKLCATTIMMEGTKAEVAYQEKELARISQKYGGIAGGASNGKRGYMLTYAIAYIRDFLAQYDIIGETYETTVPWDRIIEVCDAVAQVGLEQHQLYGLPGRPYISPRITQLYHTGVCIYFTHGFSCVGVKNPDEVFHKMEQVLRDTIMKHGGSISHHHGVGKLRHQFMDRTISPSSIELLKQIKEANDPQNIFGIRNNIFVEQQ